jgi:SAM-dependent methyltransferase
MGVKDVPSDHDFFDPGYVKRWTESIVRYRPERQQVLKSFVAEAAGIKKDELLVLELGCGPGFLAEQLLKHCNISYYALVDFSPHMLELSRKRLAAFKDRTAFLQRNFKQKNWAAALPAEFDLVVSLQAVHELRHASRIPRLYTQIHHLLVPGGSVLICDHVNSSVPSHGREAHFMTVEEHLATFKKVGFIRAREVCAAADLSLMAAEKP